jgi:NADPH:quinone reductase-like Zn-dependent oxidoreductase
VRLPAAVEDDVAAALLLKGVTADYLLRDLGRVRAGTRLLVHAAAGGVGLLVCAWARKMGAVVMGTVSSDEKARVAREHGCEHVIVTREFRFADAVQRACGGADVVIDGAGEAAREENWRRWRAADTGSASGRRADRCRRCRPMRWSQVADVLAPGGVRLRCHAGDPRRTRAAGVGCARDGTLRTPAIERIRSRQRARRMRGSSRAPRSAR